MSDQVPNRVEATKRIAQTLLAQGIINADEYDEIGRGYGFVSPRAPTFRERVRQIAPWAGYAALGAGAILQIVSYYHPGLKGPLGELIELANSLAQGF